MRTRKKPTTRITQPKRSSKTVAGLRRMDHVRADLLLGYEGRTGSTQEPTPFEQWRQAFEQRQEHEVALDEVPIPELVARIERLVAGVRRGDIVEVWT